MNVKVIQSPGYLVKGNGQKAKMNCIPPKGHSYVYWYQHVQKKEIRFLVYLQNELIIDQIDKDKNWFSAECPSSKPCTLEIKSSEPEFSALYFCASSQSTVLKC